MSSFSCVELLGSFESYNHGLDLQDLIFASLAVAVTMLCHKQMVVPIALLPEAGRLTLKKTNDQSCAAPVVHAGNLLIHYVYPSQLYLLVP